MIQRVLGRTGFSVTALGLGGYQFTGQFGVHPEVSELLIDYAVHSEINYFDTAMFYGFGESEEIVARGLAKNPSRRIYVSDKLGYFDCGVSKAAGNAAYTDETEIKRMIKHSLWVLRRDSMDILMVHEANWDVWGFDYATGDSVVLSVLEELKKEGIVQNIGIGLWDLSLATQLVETGRIDVVLCAGGMNLLERPMFETLIPAARRHHTGITLGGGLGQNNPLLAVKDPKKLPKLLNSSDSREVVAGQKLRALYHIADDLGCGMIELAIRYILSFEDIHCHVPGARCIEHLRSNIASANKGPLPADVLRSIDQIQAMGKSFTSFEIASGVELEKKAVRKGNDLPRNLLP